MSARSLPARELMRSSAAALVLRLGLRDHARQVRLRADKVRVSRTLYGTVEQDEAMEH